MQESERSSHCLSLWEASNFKCGHKERGIEARSALRGRFGREGATGQVQPLPHHPVPIPGRLSANCFPNGPVQLLPLLAHPESAAPKERGQCGSGDNRQPSVLPSSPTLSPIASDDHARAFNFSSSPHGPSPHSPSPHGPSPHSPAPQGLTG